jgi:oligosaccharide repeat unit polymerase
MMEAILLILLIVINVYFLIGEKTFLEPGPLMNWYWIINIIVGLLVYSSSYRWNWWPLFYLLGASIIFHVSYLFGKHIVVGSADINCRRTTPTVNENYYRAILIIGIISGFLYVILQLRNNGFSLSFALNNMRTTGTYFNKGRYENGGIHVSAIQQIFLMIMYATCIYSGYIYHLQKRSKLLIIINFIPAILSMLVTTAKATFVCAVLLWITGLLVFRSCKFQMHDERKTHSINNIGKIIGIAILAVIAFFAIFQSFVVRYGGTTYTNIYERILVYATGQIPSFDNLMNVNHFSLFGETYGYYSFTWICDLLDIEPIKQWSYNFNLYTALGFTNVPTIFVDFIIDFGKIGALIEVALWGVFTGLIYNMISRSSNALYYSFLGFSYYGILYSFLVNPMRYVTIAVGIILFGVFVSFEGKVHETADSDNYLLTRSI